jgi:hypothetical protein
MALTATRTANPWRFKAGDRVYIAGHPQQAAIVTAALGCGPASWPHYFVVDADGYEWRICQVQLSSSPITS